MAVQQIAYDLIRPEKDYEKVIEVIKQLGNWRHPLRSTWWVHTDKSSHEVSNAIKAAFDSNDHYFVNRLRPGEYQGWLPKDLWDWLNERA